MWTSVAAVLRQRENKEAVGTPQPASPKKVGGGHFRGGGTFHFFRGKQQKVEHTPSKWEATFSPKSWRGGPLSGGGHFQFDQVIRIMTPPATQRRASLPHSQNKRRQPSAPFPPALPSLPSLPYVSLPSPTGNYLPVISLPVSLPSLDSCPPVLRFGFR